MTTSSTTPQIRVYHSHEVVPDAPLRSQRGPYTLAAARARVQYLLAAGVSTAAVRDDRALGAPDDREWGEADAAKACYVTYEQQERAAAGAVFAAKPWVRA
jgi:hypothetical protein